MPRTPLWRNVVRFAGPAVLAVGVIVFVVARWTGDSAGEKALPPGPNAPVARSTADQKALTPAIRQIADRFIQTAVARKDTAASWDLIDPTFPSKSEFTRATWAKGDIPVVPTGYPFKAEGVRYSVEAVFPGTVVLDVVIIPTNKARTQRFQLSVKRHGSGAGERWLVDYWMTRYVPGVLANPQ
jgi:hypothetical protein